MLSSKAQQHLALPFPGILIATLRKLPSVHSIRLTEKLLIGLPTEYKPCSNVKIGISKPWVKEAAPGLYAVVERVLRELSLRHGGDRMGEFGVGEETFAPISEKEYRNMSQLARIYTFSMKMDEFWGSPLYEEAEAFLQNKKAVLTGHHKIGLHKRFAYCVDAMDLANSYVRALGIKREDGKDCFEFSKHGELSRLSWNRPGNEDGRWGKILNRIWKTPLRISKAPNEVRGFTKDAVFLADSIFVSKDEKWEEKLTALEDYVVDILDSTADWLLVNSEIKEQLRELDELAGLEEGALEKAYLAHRTTTPEKEITEGEVTPLT